MKVCFYLNTYGLEKKDFSNPLMGNPGIGGTEFMFWTISFYLKKLYPKMDVVVFANYIDTLPKEITAIKCKDEIEAVKICKEINGDIFIFKGPYHDIKLFNLIDELKVKSIMWSHNYESIIGSKYASGCKYLKRNLCVGKEQYDRLRDHKVFEKSAYIYNCLDFSPYKSRDIKKKNIVTFMGGLRVTKGFNILAKVWKEVVKEVPDAELHVMGGSKLYDENASTGSFGIADEKFEKRFMPYLLDDNGKVMNSVKFLGVLNGDEKINAINETKVGIANPSGFGETFCISAIEFEAMKVPVVSCKKNGLLDTVEDGKSGILVKNEKYLKDAIVTLLKDDKLNEDMGLYGEKFVREKFDIYNVCSEWKKLLEDVYNDVPQKEELINNNFKYNLKWLREFNRKIKKSKIFNWLPPISEYEERIVPKFKKL